MSRLVVEHVQALDPDCGMIGSCLTADRGHIVDFEPCPARRRAEADCVDGGGKLLTPGLIDVHIHGVGQHLFESGPQDLLDGMTLLPRYGVTGVLPTLYRVMQPKLLPQLAELSRALGKVDCVYAPGFHLEGPFLALPGAGADTMGGDVKLLADILGAAPNRVASMSISPETPGIVPVIERLVEAGVVVFMTHTGANVGQTQRAIDAGARHATHFYDVFPLPPQTEPGVRPVGVVETVLADQRVSVDFIADGVHVHPMAIKAALAAKGSESVLLITDANIGAGMPDGMYQTPWGFPVSVRKDDAARIHDPGAQRHGVLAGSSLTMNRGISNLLDWLDMEEHDVWAMGTANPARLLGWHDRGRLQRDAAADLVLWDRDETGQYHAAQTWFGGRCVYEQQEGAVR
ncbi:MAG: amidohydrolase family protein [Phycisphaeraceae bacterium]|nr:amidohydrolase family protein [Phycisphaeraceae bacterium]